MEKLMNEMVERIAQQLPELSVVCEDYGQLENAEEYYPVTFPCVLVSVPKTEWTNHGTFDQRGTCAIVTKLAFDCASPEEHELQRMEERQTLAAKLHRIMQGSKFATSGKLSRVQTVSLFLPDKVVVYETHYTANVFDTVIG